MARQLLAGILKVIGISNEVDDISTFMFLRSMYVYWVEIIFLNWTSHNLFYTSDQHLSLKFLLEVYI